MAVAQCLTKLQRYKKFKNFIAYKQKNSVAVKLEMYIFVPAQFWSGPRLDSQVETKLREAAGHYARCININQAILKPMWIRKFASYYIQFKCLSYLLSPDSFIKIFNEARSKLK